MAHGMMCQEVISGPFLRVFSVALYHRTEETIPIILNPKAPLHSLVLRERDTCRDPHSEGHASPGRHDLTETPSEGHVSYDQNSTTSPVCNLRRCNHRISTGSRQHLPPESEKKRDQNSTLEPKTIETIDLETSIYALKYINHLRSIQKINKDFQIESQLDKETKSVDRELIPDQTREEAGERTVLSEPPLSWGRKPAKPVLLEPPFFENEKRCRKNHRFPESSLLAGVEFDRSSG
ncbi:hypothetical protein Bca101_098806 [Brassica carinata]